MIKTTSLIASLSRNAGGLFESVRRLHQSLNELSGIRVVILGLEDQHTQADVGKWDPLEVHSFPVHGPDQFGYAPALRRKLMAMDEDIIHVHGIWMYPSVAALAWHREAGRPYMISPHGMLDPWAVQNSSWKKRIAHALYEGAHLRKAACIRALCESEAQSIRAYGLKNPIAILPNGIDLPSESREQKVESRNAPWTGAVEPGRKVLLFLSRIHPKKGLVNLLKAWKQTINSQPSTINSWCLAIAGWDQGGHEAELKQLATDLGIPWSDLRNIRSTESPSSVLRPPSSVVFLGPQFGENKDAAYRSCDAFILPSFSEGLPMVILEAWAYGKPVLMTPECNLPEGFAANAAIRIEPTTEGIEAGLQKLFHSSLSDLHSTGSRGRTLVAEKFTWPRIATDMKSVYDWILGTGPKPDCIHLS